MAVNGGSIRLGFELDTKQLQAELSKAYKELERLTNERAKLTKEKYQLQIDMKPFQEMFAKSKELDANFKNIRNTYNQMLTSDANSQEITKLYNEMAKAREQAEDYKEKVREAYPEYEKQLTRMSEINTALQQNTTSIGQQNEKIKDTGDKLEKAKNRFDMSSIKKGIGDVKGVVGKLSNSITGIIRKMAMWLLAIFSIRSAYSMVRNSIGTITSYNDQLKADIDYMKFALGSTFQPIIETIVNLAYKLLAVVGAIIKTLTGYNIFTNATIDNFKKTQGAIDKTNSSAKKLQKTLASFDEMNVLNDSSSSGGSGSGSGFTMPSIDLSATDLFKNWNLEKALSELANKINTFFETTDFGEIGEALGRGISDFFNNISDFLEKINWEEIGKDIANFLYRVPWLDVIKSVLRFIWTLIKSNWRLTGSMMQELGKNIGEDVKTAIEEKGGVNKILEDVGDWIIETLVNGAKSVVQTYLLGLSSKILQELLKNLGFSVDENGNTNGENKKMEGVGGNLSTSIGNGIRDKIANIINPFTNIDVRIGEKFNGVKSKIQEKLSPVLSYLQNTFIPQMQQKFSSIGSKVGDIIGSAFKTVVNGIISLIETRINSSINIINKLINVVKSLPLVSGLTSKIGNVSTIKLPRLAKGGIINMPNKGVMVGSAVAGESGREGVLPLTDSQAMEQLGEAIGRYITINANITNTMNGRVISRELQKINNENSFAFNR